MQGRHVFLVEMPVRIRLLDDDLALFQDALKQKLDFETLTGVTGSDRHVVEIDE